MYPHLVVSLWHLSGFPLVSWYSQFVVSSATPPTVSVTLEVCVPFSHLGFSSTRYKPLLTVERTAMAKKSHKTVKSISIQRRVCEFDINELAKSVSDDVSSILLILLQWPQPLER